ncbi:MAG: hypothetical protein WA913_13535 [Pricia sp.]
MKKLVLLSLSTALFWSCNMEKEEKGELPEVDVDVSAEEGNLPEYDVNWADVNVGTTTKMVEVPKVVVVMEEEEVEVPVVDVDMPNGGEKSERTLMVETEVTGKEHNIEIKEIWAADNNLYVIAQLEELEQEIGDQKMRVSDQISLNAPELNVNYMIVGDKPDREFNNKNNYVASMEAAKEEVGDHEVIYTR